jgi:hypothetical protein
MVRFVAIPALLLASLQCGGASMQEGDSVSQLSEADLHNLKQTAIAYLREAQPENWKVHVEELEASAVFDDDDGQQIGIWIVSREGDVVVLTRDADLAEAVVRYGLVFERTEGGGFAVVRDFWERETFE